MKKFFALVAFLLMAAPALAQEYIYCELVGIAKLASTKVNVSVDFGQATKIWSDNRLVGEDGKPIVFNSMVDAMNWMGSQGWEFAQAYVVTMGGQNVYHWLLKKDISTLTDSEKELIKESFKTKAIVKEASK